MDKYLLAVLVDNKPGVLTHIAGLISRRAFNIESISAGYTEETSVTRINIVVSVASENELRQVVTQLSKLIDVVKIVNLTQYESITRELVLIKVHATKETRAEIIDVVNIFRARIVDVGTENVVVELTGDAKKIDALSELLSDYGIIEIARTGAIALSRGPIPGKQMGEIAARCKPISQPLASLQMSAQNGVCEGTDRPARVKRPRVFACSKTRGCFYAMLFLTFFKKTIDFLTKNIYYRQRKLALS